MHYRWWVGVAAIIVWPCLGGADDMVFQDGFEWASICAWDNLWYTDNDDDSWGATGTSGVGVACPAPPGFAPNNGDCDDSEELINPAAPEVCNGLDDDCDGIGDNGPFGDPVEPNDSCGSATVLASVGSNQLIQRTDLSVFGSGDHDYFKIPARETDSSCSCCDYFCLDEDFQLKITLTVPAAAGSYRFCSGASCAGVDDNCLDVVSGQSMTWTWTLDGSCSEADGGDYFVHIHGLNPPGFSCSPYVLEYEFTPGCF